MNPRGSVVSLHVAPTGAAPIQNRDRVEAIAGRGLEGDRYFAGIGTYSHVPGSGRHVTLIEIEAIEGLKHDYDIDVAPGKSRRNIVLAAWRSITWSNGSFSSVECVSAAHGFASRAHTWSD